jgi:predicted membrane-bound spermidine synthase
LHPSPAAPRLPGRLAFALLLGVFFASGFAALLYQVVWQRVLAIFSGSDVFSVTIIVSAFMGGLGCGSFAGGTLADRLSRARCLAAFAGAELAIAGFAVLSKAYYYDVLYGRLGAVELPFPLLGALLFASVLWPTFFMGLSLPLLARGATGALEAAARTVGSLYGWNTLGAAAGALCTTWLLLRRFDFETCLRAGAALNAACAFAVLPLRRALAPAPQEDPPPAAARAGREAPPVAPVFGVPVWLLLYGLSGAIALSLEIAWFRALGVMLKSTSFTFGTLLAVFLVGVGGGSVVGARRVERGVARPAERFLLLQAGIAVYAGLSLALLVHALDRVPALAPLRVHFAGTDAIPLGSAFAELARQPLGVWTSLLPGAAHARQLVWLYGFLPLALIGPPTFLMGFSFPYLQRAVQTDARFLGRRVGWLQTANIAGSLLGSLLTGFLLLPRLGSAGTFRGLVLASGVFALLLGRARAAAPGGALRFAPALGAAAAVALAAAALPPGQVLWARLHGALPERVLVAEDASGLSLLRPIRRERIEHVVMVGGLEVSSIPFGGYEGIHTVLGALPVLLHPAPRRVAVIGLGSGDTIFSVAGRAEVEEALVIEIVGSELDLLRAHLAQSGDPGLRALFADPRIRFVIGDGRSVIRRDPHGFDVIEADALRPTSAYAGNLYSLEYFALLRRSLRPGGLAVSWLPTARVQATFVRSFPHVLLLEQMAVGSNDPIPFDRAALLARLEDPFVRDYFARARIDIRRLVTAHLAAREPVLLSPGSDRSAFEDVNRDLFPKDEFLVDGGR